MKMRTILVTLLPDSQVEAILDGALVIAMRMSAHMEVLLLQPDPLALAGDYATASLSCAMPIDAMREETQRNARILEKRFQTWRDANDLPQSLVDGRLDTTYGRWSPWEGSPEIGLIRRGRLTDLIVMDLPEHRLALRATLLDSALFETGRPVLLLPAPIVVPPLTRVALAWNGSLQATRSLVSAMPLLHEAEEVIVCTIDTAMSAPDPACIPAADVIESLSWHGIRARRASIVPGHAESVGGALLKEVTALDISMLVMGAFTHSRVRETLLGGVTRYVLDHARIPLLMMH
jgi:nucleotide-binding universal stress UspA family protein